MKIERLSRAVYDTGCYKSHTWTLALPCPWIGTVFKRHAKVPQKQVAILSNHLKPESIRYNKNHISIMSIQTCIIPLAFAAAAAIFSLLTSA